MDHDPIKNRVVMERFRPRMDLSKVCLSVLLTLIWCLVSIISILHMCLIVLIFLNLPFFAQFSPNLAPFANFTY